MTRTVSWLMHDGHDVDDRLVPEQRTAHARPILQSHSHSIVRHRHPSSIIVRAPANSVACVITIAVETRLMVDISSYGNLALDPAQLPADPYV